MSDDDGRADFDAIDVLELQIVNPKRKAPMAAGNKHKRNRKLVFAWDRQTESALIAAVQKNPPIWDSSREDYKNPNLKADIWKQVAAELNIEEVDVAEARHKWQSLRSHFKACLAKFRCRKSGQAIAELTTVSWPHLSEMMFIESGEVAQSCLSTSTTELEGAYNDTSIVNYITQSTNPQSSFESVHPTPTPKHVLRREARAKSPAIPQSPSPSFSSHSNSGSMRNSAAEVLGNNARKQQDRYDVFGQLVALNLRRLPEDVAFNLEGRIMHLIYSLPPPQQLSPPFRHRGSPLHRISRPSFNRLLNDQ